MKPNAKIIGQYRYFHLSQLSVQDEITRNAINLAISIAHVNNDQFNVIKVTQDLTHISLLSYPTFFDIAYPALEQYWTVDIASNTARFRTFKNSLNPPILHRKELLLAADHPRQALYQSLTQAAEQIGLFDDPNRIGFQKAWDNLLNLRGYRVSDHTLIPIGNDESNANPVDESDFSGVLRHRTALTRYGFSAPIQSLARFGFLDGSKTIFDYGCGRGDDVRGLKENNLDARGWDPYFCPDQDKQSADIVNLGFVINVIENIEERNEALQGAYALAGELLVISAMLANQDAVKGVPYADGVLTSRNTFQKYYTQAELKQYISDTLQEDAIPVGPGIFYVFKDKAAEQRFMYGRLENKRNVLRLKSISRPEKNINTHSTQSKYDMHRSLLERLWETCLILGRDPERSELTHLAIELEAFGTLPAALRLIKQHKNNLDAIMESARFSRMDDLRVYFAQLQFEKRKPYRHLESRLQRDIKCFFGDYNTAVEEGRKLIFSLSNVDAISQACHAAAELGIGWLEDGKSLQLHTSLVEQLPSILRAYIRCGTVLYGDVSSADMIKIHIRSGKLTLLKFDNFSDQLLPKMVQRIKINLRRQELDIFDYGVNYPPPYLYKKSRYINEEFPFYSEQIAFEEALENLAAFDMGGYGPTAAEFDAKLATLRYQIVDLQLVRSQEIPCIDAACGQFLKYRDFIECGETQHRTNLANLPKCADSYTALYELAKNVLDPIIEYFGMVKLTYGFCSPELGKHIRGSVAPKLDQHAAHETNRMGNLICAREGAAVDFYIDDENMLEVTKWIVENIAFDRIYFYGSDKPIHISYCPNPKGQLTLMLHNDKTNTLIPKTITTTKFLNGWQENPADVT
jgi:DNA phosphorothioation-associated putative methyltransferase